MIIVETVYRHANLSDLRVAMRPGDQPRLMLDNVLLLNLDGPGYILRLVELLDHVRKELEK